MKAPLGWVPAAIFAVAMAVSGAAQAEDDGAQLYGRNCRPCHAPGQTGYVMLGRRLGPARADLALRGDVLPDLVRFVVRHGFNSMPQIPRGSVSDAELERIIAYLNRPGSSDGGDTP